MNLGDALAENNRLRARLAELEERLASAQGATQAYKEREREALDSAFGCESLMREIVHAVDDAATLADARTAVAEIYRSDRAARGRAELEAQLVPEGWRPVPIKSLVNLLRLIDPEPVGLPSGKFMVFRNPNAAEMLRRVSAEVRTMLAVAPQPETPARGWDAQAYASMRDEIEYWKRKAAESDEALERIRNDLGPTHMGEPVIAASPKLSGGAQFCDRHGGYGFQRDCLECNEERAALAAQPDVATEEHPAEDIDQTALDLAKKVWAIGNRHGPDTQRKSEIQEALADFLRARAQPNVAAETHPVGEREAFTDDMWGAMESTLDSRGFRVGASDLERADYEAMWQAARAQLGAVPDAEFLSVRLARVASLVGVPMPGGTHDQIAGIAGSILGQIARAVSAMVDRADLMLDEFLRIKACPDVTDEIAQLCDRAVFDMRQHTPVIEQRDQAEREVRRLKAELGSALTATGGRDVAMILPQRITECRECGSSSLTWGTHYKTDSGVEQGRLSTSEVRCLFVLGCDECSETLSVVSAEQIAAAPQPAQEKDPTIATIIRDMHGEIEG